MRVITSFFIACCLLWACTPAIAQDFRQYPGSKFDGKASRQASGVSTVSQVYVTSDSFEKLYSFYKGIYKEFQWRLPAQKLSSGEEVKWAFFILDGGKDLAHSKLWMKIQRPYIGTIGDGVGPDFKDVRDISVIQIVRSTGERKSRLEQ